MSLLVIQRSVGEAGSGDLASRRALAEARRQGFVHPEELRWTGGTAWLYPTPRTPRGTGSLWRQGPRFAACVGCFHWKGRTGEAALQALMDCGTLPSQLPLAEVSGGFALLMGGPDGVWLFNDVLGLQKLYACPETGVLSTSLMVCRASLRNPAVDRLRAQEYVLTGATHGTRTPVLGLDILDPARAQRLDEAAAVELHAPRHLHGQDPTSGFDEAVALMTDTLKREFGHIASAFGPDIGMALSGGFDSRLLLAGLHQAGVKPKLFVYGPRQSADVVVAKSVAGRLGMAIESIDKSVVDNSLPPLTAEHLRSNYAFFDGLPVDGVFDRGADQATRLQQVEGGRLNLNGGGGEILRNFFYLPDRPHSAADVVGAFYSGWLDDVFATSDDRHAFFTAMQDQVLLALGRAAGTQRARHEPIPRSEVELVYPLFRLRYWMSRNNAIAIRQGPFQTPLVTPELVKLAAALPLAHKDHGRLESAVITRLATEVARGPSAYGFDFSVGPGWRQRLSTWLTLYRPIWARHQSVRVQRALGRLQVAVAPAEWCAALGQEPQADWLNPRALLDMDQINRLLTLQGLLDDQACGVAR